MAAESRQLQPGSVSRRASRAFCNGAQRASFVLCLLLAAVPSDARGAAHAPGSFRAGAATSNVTPWLGLSINGGMQDRKVEHVHDEIHARALVLDDGRHASRSSWRTVA